MNIFYFWGHLLKLFCCSGRVSPEGGQNASLRSLCCGCSFASPARVLLFSLSFFSRLFFSVQKSMRIQKQTRYEFKKYIHTNSKIVYQFKKLMEFKNIYVNSKNIHEFTESSWISKYFSIQKSSKIFTKIYKKIPRTKNWKQWAHDVAVWARVDHLGLGLCRVRGT